MAELGNPQDELRFIHLAGTNGKGSIHAFTASILRAAGYTVGAYISPSVMGYLEKFQVNGQWMAEDELAPLVAKTRLAAESMVAKGLAMPTVFEFETAIAFLYFKQKNCDYVVLETGLGGDLDSTNVVTTTDVCAFASISLDHTGFLGSTIEEIASKKAGIIKPGSIVIPGWQTEAAASVLRSRAEELACELRSVDPSALVIEGPNSFSYRSYNHIEKSLLGNHQFENATTAIEIIEALRSRGAIISDVAVKDGIETSYWPGRLERIAGTPEFILDGAHNPAAAERLREGLELLYRENGDDSTKIHAVIGIFKDKDYHSVLGTLAPLLADAKAIALPDAVRTLDADSVAAVLSSLGVDATTAPSIEEAIDEAASRARADGGIVLVTGSLSYLGQAREHIDSITDITLESEATNGK